MAGELLTRSLGIRWADMVALVLAYGNNNLTEEHLASAVRTKLNRHIPDARYYASMEAYTAAKAGIPAGDLLFITVEGAMTLYVRTDAGETLICTFPSGGGSAEVTAAAVAAAIGQMDVTQKAGLQAALGYLTQHQSLAGYVTDTALAAALASYVTSTGLSTELANYVTLTGLASAIADFVTSTGLNTVLASYVTSNALTAALAGYVAKDAQGTWTVNHTQPVVRKADGSLWVLPPGEGSGDTVIENTALITMTTYGGDDYASLEAEDIFNILDAGAKNIILIDRAGRQCNLIVPPEEETNDFTVAKFWTFDESNAEIIVYSVGDGGLVSSTTVPIPSGGSGVSWASAPTAQQAGYILVAGNNGTASWVSVTNWQTGGSY